MCAAAGDPARMSTTKRWLVAIGSLVGALAFAAGAAGEHSVLELVSTGPAGGNDAGRGERRHPRGAVLDAAASSPRV